MLRCPKCGESLIFDQETGEYVCRNGHVVYEHVIDRRREWKTGDREELMKRSRVGHPIRFSDPNPYSTMIGPVSATQRGTLVGRLKRTQHRVSTDQKVRKKSQLVELMEEVASHMGLPQVVVEEASRIYSKMERNKIKELKGRRLAPLAIALLYYASKTQGVNRSLEEFLKISNMWNVKKSALRRAVRNYYMTIKETGISSRKQSQTPATKRNVISYISRFANKLGISPRAEKLAKELASQVEFSSLAGRNPKGLAAAMLNIACNVLNENIRQQDLSNISEISTVTIRKRKREIFDNYIIEITPKTC